MRTAPVPPHVMWHEVECGRYAADLPLWAELARAAPDGSSTSGPARAGWRCRWPAPATPSPRSTSTPRC